MQQKAIVEDVVWDGEAAAWKILLDWGDFGRSRVWLHDELRVWYRWGSSN